MAYKLGTGRQPYAISGEVRTKLRFKKESGDHDISVPGTPIIRKDLEEGVMGEANMDGSIYLSNTIEPGSKEERQVINHEMRHATDIKIGKLSYEDDHIKWNGNTYERADVNGVDSILVDGEWKEAGAHDFPWEQEANNGNGNI